MLQENVEMIPIPPNLLDYQRRAATLPATFVPILR